MQIGSYDDLRHLEGSHRPTAKLGVVPHSLSVWTESTALADAANVITSDGPGLVFRNISELQTPFALSQVSLSALSVNGGGTGTAGEQGGGTLHSVNVRHLCRYRHVKFDIEHKRTLKLTV